MVSHARALAALIELTIGCRNLATNAFSNAGLRLGVPVRLVLLRRRDHLLKQVLIVLEVARLERVSISPLFFRPNIRQFVVLSWRKMTEDCILLTIDFGSIDSFRKIGSKKCPERGHFCI